MATNQLPSSNSSSNSTTTSDADRDPELERAEADIARTRVRVAGNILALRREVARRTDWREWVRRRPLGFLAGAFLLGAFFGSRGRSEADGNRRRSRG